MPTTILASRYNILWTSVNKILGTPNTSTPGYGYGQTLLSGPVNPNTSKIDDSQYIALYADIVRIDAHQNGAGAITTQPFVVGDYDTNAGNTDLVEEAYIVGLESKMSALDTNRFSIDAVGQADIVELEDSSTSPLTTSRSLIWNTSINHIFTVTFPSQASRDAFFNAGGQVRCAPRISYTGSQAKTLTWQQLCSDVGSVQMGPTNTVDSTGKVVNQGYNNLTSTYKRVYTSNSGLAYVNSVVALDALLPSSTQVQFKLQLLDNHGETIDEYVQGVVTNSVFLRVPNGEVSFNGQTYTTVSYNDTPIGANVSNF